MHFEQQILVSWPWYGVAVSTPSLSGLERINQSRMQFCFFPLDSAAGYTLGFNHISPLPWSLLSVTFHIGLCAPEISEFRLT